MRRDLARTKKPDFPGKAGSLVERRARPGGGEICGAKGDGPSEASASARLDLSTVGWTGALQWPLSKGFSGQSFGIFPVFLRGRGSCQIRRPRRKRKTPTRSRMTSFEAQTRRRGCSSQGTAWGSTPHPAPCSLPESLDCVNNNLCFLLARPQNIAVCVFPVAYSMACRGRSALAGSSALPFFPSEGPDKEVSSPPCASRSPSPWVWRC